MNIFEKIQFALQPNPLAIGWRANLDYTVIKYLQYRRSRWGFKPLLKWLLNRYCYEFHLAEYANYRIYGRYSDRGDYLAIEECFEKQIYDFSKITIVPDLILDIGSHIGSFTLLAHFHYPELPIMSFEPDPGNFEVLQKNMMANGVTTKTHRLALSNTCEEKYLGGSVGVGKHLNSQEGILVSVDRLSKIVDFTSVNFLLMKCDVEGSEFEILDDCLSYLPQNTFMFIEVHEGESAVFRLKHILQATGFQVEVTGRKGLAVDCVAKRGEYLL